MACMWQVGCMRAPFPRPVTGIGKFSRDVFSVFTLQFVPLLVILEFTHQNDHEDAIEPVYLDDFDILKL